MMFLLAKVVGSKVAPIILNVLRALNIITILALIVANGSLLVKDIKIKASNFEVFEGAEKVLVILIALFVLITELPKVLTSYIDEKWPAFGHRSGFMALSFALLRLGCNALAELARHVGTTTNTRKSLGVNFYSMVVGAGILAIIMSVLNILATMAFADRANGLTARAVRSSRKGAEDVSVV